VPTIPGMLTAGPREERLTAEHPVAEFQIPYGRTYLPLRLPDEYRAELLAPAQVVSASDPAQAVREALANPVGGVRLADFARARSVAIAINDKTRPVPHAILLPPLLKHLVEMGVPRDAITFLIAAGVHVPMRQDEFAKILPTGILARYRVICHNADNQESLVHLGETRRGTPVWINRTYAEADLRIVVGNLEPHQFMGFSGGVKTAAIGLAGRNTIDRNHAMLLDSRANIARYDDNPMRQDVEEIGRMIGVHFALNDVINANKEIVHVLAGEPQAVMRQGIPRLLELYEVRVAAPFDLMIVAPGGHPKDINLYQAQKALGHATPVTKPGGTVIFVAACPEGTGSKSYEEWMVGMTSYEAVLERFKREGFRIGPHKAFQIARDGSRERVLMITEMAPDFVKRLLLTPRKSLDAALALALKNLPPKARIGVMPWANATIPLIAT
jgi:nickel-dependent lactate racemase